MGGGVGGSLSLSLSGLGDGGKPTGVKVWLDGLQQPVGVSGGRSSVLSSSSSSSVMTNPGVRGRLTAGFHLPLVIEGTSVTSTPLPLSLLSCHLLLGSKC